MTEEEIAALAAKVNDLEAKNKELEAKIPTPVPTVDPDLAFKPKTWAELKEREEQTAKQIAMDVLKEAEEKKQAEQKKQEEAVAEQSKKIDEAFAKLQEEGIIAETKEPNDLGAQQRKQVLASLVRSGGQHVDVEARKLKSAWDAGLEYDDVTNSFKKAGTSANPNRDQFVASSANRVVSPAQKGGPINVQGVRGDLDLARKRWEEAGGKI